MNETTARRTGIVLLWGVLFLCASASSVVAMWAAPPPIEWGKSADGAFEFKKENKTGTITVYKAGDRKKAQWQVVVPEFYMLFSKIMLTNKGDRILHVRSNHQVRKLDDTAVHVLQKDGTFCTLKVREFIGSIALPQGQLRVSTAPSVMWLKKVAELTDKSFTIVNAKGKKTTFTFKELAKRMRRR
jgi:hypothetical protein